MKASAPAFAVVVVALASQTPAQLSPMAPANNNVRNCPPPGFNIYGPSNLLQNSTMYNAVVGPHGPATKYTGAGYGGPAAAAHWFVYNNTTGTTHTGFAGGFGLTPKVLRVSTTAAGNGIAQKWPITTGPVVAVAYLHVYSGKVCIALGNGPTNACGGTLGVTGDDVPIAACASQAGELTIYSVAGPATFTLTAAKVSKVE